MNKSSCRVDRWLWAVRIFRTRSLSKEACVRGAIRVNGSAAKPSASVKSGDRVTVKIRGSLKELEVIQTLEKRVGPALAANYYIDHSPASAQNEPTVSFNPVAKRERGSGRPTKRDRRHIDRLRGS
ncbi:MAG TPA: RNA-binding protein [Acidimicrobiaceae bacterium]|nr:RNA-binding protein [Acidimicrobiaceae bacterium]HAX06121.1 RNA-binding protein [Acidimicrobiaceae bacterium]